MPALIRLLKQFWKFVAGFCMFLCCPFEVSLFAVVGWFFLFSLLLFCFYRWIPQLFNMKTKSCFNNWRHRSLKCMPWSASSRSWEMSNVLMTRLWFRWIKCGIRFFPLCLIICVCIFSSPTSHYIYVYYSWLMIWSCLGYGLVEIWAICKCLTMKSYQKVASNSLCKVHLFQ